MTGLSPAHELLADLGRRVMEEEMKVRERTDRIAEYDDPDVKDRIREEWAKFYQAIEPMRRQQQYILKQLAIIEGAKIPAPIVVMNGDVLIP